MTEVMVDPKLEASWKAVLKDEFQKPYFKELKLFLLNEKKRRKVIYPPGNLIFNSFSRCPFDKLKVVILGQDPYHGHGQAHGLCFSVPKGIPYPPSLVNIFKELQSDCGIPMPKGGNLERWAAQGVLLLNSSLTVRAHQPFSHSNIGWEEFTDAVIDKINLRKKGVVFLLWGKPAQEKGRFIDEFKHYVLSTSSISFFRKYGFFRLPPLF